MGVKSEDGGVGAENGQIQTFRKFQAKSSASPNPKLSSKAVPIHLCNFSAFSTDERQFNKN